MNSNQLLINLDYDYIEDVNKKGVEKMNRLEKKVAIVTGASSGLGYATAKLFAIEGASVIALARRKEKLDQLVKETQAEGGKNIIALAGDVTKDEDIENAVKTAVNKFGKLDIFVNNAGLVDKLDPVADMPNDIWNAVVDVNLSGPMRAFRAAIPEMLKVGGGAFVTVSSLGGLFGSRCGPAYTATKHGVIGLAKNVAFQYAKKNIRSNVIAPGYVTSEMAAQMAPGTGVNEEGLQSCAMGVNLSPRTGDPEEIAQLALFLASDDASLVNGAVVTADAGWSCY